MVDRKIKKKVKPKAKVVKAKSKIVKKKISAKRSKPKAKIVNAKPIAKMNIKDVTIDAYDPSWGIGALVGGLIGLFTSIIPFVGLLFGGFAIVAYFLQAKIKNTDTAIAGLIIGIVAVLINILFIVLFSMSVFAVNALV